MSHLKRSLRGVALISTLALSSASMLLAQAEVGTRELETEVAREVPVQIVAEIQLDGGKIVFVDETVDGVFGLGILEVGNTRLFPYYEKGATALEMFLALAPAGSVAPWQLHHAHELAARKDPSIPAEPRRFMTLKTAIDYPFDQDTSNCWSWGGGTVSNYATAYGFPSHDTLDTHDAFEIWSDIPDSVYTGSVIYADEDAIPAGEAAYPTPVNNQRAIAMCVPYAVATDEGSSCPSNNTVNYRVRIKGEEGLNYWYSAWEYVNAYGEGVRYSSEIGSSRRYTLEVVDISTKSIYCQEKYEVHLRWQINPPRAD